MEDEADHQEDRNPGNVTERDQTGSSEEFAKTVDVHEREFRLGVRLLQRGGDHAREQRAGNSVVEPQARTYQHARPDPFKQAVDGKHGKGDAGQRKQRHFAAALQYPIVDLKHVKRADEHQEVDCRAEHNHGTEDGPVGPKSIAKSVLHHEQYAIVGKLLTKRVLTEQKGPRRLSSSPATPLSRSLLYCRTEIPTMPWSTLVGGRSCRDYGAAK